MYRFIAKFSCKQNTGNSAKLIETALSKYDLSCNKINTVYLIQSGIVFISYPFFTDVFVELNLTNDVRVTAYMNKSNICVYVTNTWGDHYEIY